jgi:hypothetical protein
MCKESLVFMVSEAVTRVWWMVTVVLMRLSQKQGAQCQKVEDRLSCVGK